MRFVNKQLFNNIMYNTHYNYTSIFLEKNIHSIQNYSDYKIKIY